MIAWDYSSCTQSIGTGIKVVMKTKTKTPTSTAAACTCSTYSICSTTPGIFHCHSYSHIASYPAFMEGGKNAWFQPFAHARNFPEIWETVLLLYSSMNWLCITILFLYSSAYGHLQRQWRWVLISLGMTHYLHRRNVQWPEAMEKWLCGDCFAFSSVILRDDH